MKKTCLATLTMLAMLQLADAQTLPAISPAISTPDKVETRLGTLQFNDGAPNAETVAKIYDNLDFTHAFETFVNTFQGVNMEAIRKGFLSIGVKDNEILVFSKLMDAKSLFLTANADTVYFVGFIDLTKGPMVLETPPDALGTLDDYWWRWVIDFGAPGPDRGLGGKYLLLPPDYNGPLPQGGYYMARSRTTRVLILGRMFLVNNDPRQWRSDEHYSTQRLQLLRNAQRSRATGTGHSTRPRAYGAAGRHRHHQRQALCTGRPDEENPHRGACARQRHLARSLHEAA